ncbi:TetR family transcriptional regulator [Streptomyces sp. A7024]|uniref:TetR family transcriptional regulator n=1 Tax=Streptomyces coryli TaxID=1128680 RepID=A0A6G4U1M4_9ACTN|nr:TetR/AcrR family transcriptional regulator [Streptomyces coryli]NGN65606.1 TetR family transcriptional regulator [Streptomyces coryli]
MPDRPTQILQATARLIAHRGVRGLRVEEVAAEAGVSTALIYYHFKNRAGLLRHTLDFINRRAIRYTEPDVRAPDPRAQLTDMLLMELQDDPSVRENSAAWGELRATAVFDSGLHEELAAATTAWVTDVADLIRQSEAAQDTDPQAAAERLVALVEGLSQQWLSRTLTLERARELLRSAVDRELR